VKVILPSPLTDYTDGRREIAADGVTLDGVLRDLDRQFAGIRFRVIDEQERIRPHIKLFVNGALQRKLDVAVQHDDEIIVIAALSGG
jgi:molybdopterin converting factor small subunit